MSSRWKSLVQTHRRCSGVNGVLEIQIHVGSSEYTGGAGLVSVTEAHLRGVGMSVKMDRGEQTPWNEWKCRSLQGRNKECEGELD